MYFYVFFFFFQAEDGIRDDLVTGVQTCALPISFSRNTLYCCVRVFLKSCSSAWNVPVGTAMEVGIGAGTPSFKKIFGAPPEAALLITGPYELVNGALFRNDCDM